MKKIYIYMLVLLTSSTAIAQQSTIVGKYGQLQARGNRIIGSKGDTVVLRGMSLFWSQWMGQYYNAATTQWLRDDWKCTVVRPAMGVDMGGYLENPDKEKAKVIAVADAAIALGIYVIIDYHAHEAHKNTPAAVKFFTEMAQRYAGKPNVIYELYNEPLQAPTWSGDIKPYCETVIAEIRKYDTKNLIVCGTRQWSQLVSEAAADPIKDVNVAYTLHYYAGTHKQDLRNEAQAALDKGIALFCTEYGTCDASGNSGYSIEESKTWWAFLEKNKISYCNWSIADKVETASAIKPGASGQGGWTADMITESGLLVKAQIASQNAPVWASINTSSAIKDCKESCKSGDKNCCKEGKKKKAKKSKKEKTKKK